MHRFFVEKIKDNIAIINNLSDCKHIRLSLRLKKGDYIEIVYQEKVYVAKLITVQKEQVTAEITRKSNVGLCQNNYDKSINLFLALIKPSKFELAIEKCTEIGVDTIVPIKTERSNIPINVYIKKLPRFEKIAISASKQSKQVAIPKISMPLRINDAISQAKGRIICFDFSGRHLVSQNSKNKNIPINIFIGPEGGFTYNELQLFNKFEVYKLPTGVLCSETAAISAALLARLNLL